MILKERSRNLRTAIFCLVGFAYSFKPSEPYIAPFLVNVKGFTKVQVDRDVFPLWLYAYAPFLVIVGLLCEFVSHKVVILLGLLMRVGTRFLILYGASLLLMQLSQITFAFASAGEAIFFASVYLCSAPEDFQRITSFTRAAVLLGHVTSAVLSSLLLRRSSLRSLFLVSLITVCIAFLVGLMLPLPFRRRGDVAAVATREKRVSYQTLRLLSKYKLAEGSRVWVTCFVACVMALSLAMNYSTLFLSDFDASKKHEKNGYVMAASRLVGFFGTLIPSWFKPVFDEHGRVFSFLLPMVCGAALLVGGASKSFMIAAICFALFYGTTELLMSLCSARIARHISGPVYGVVFGALTFAASLASILVQVLFSAGFLHSNVRAQFRFFGLLQIAVAFLVAASQKRRRGSTHGTYGEIAS